MVTFPMCFVDGANRIWGWAFVSGVRETGLRDDLYIFGLEQLVKGGGIYSGGRDWGGAGVG